MMGLPINSISEVRALAKNSVQEKDGGLLPCPFCGGKAKYINVDGQAIKTFEYEYIVIECTECHCSTPSCEDDNLAYSFWQTRVG